jgi:hypothetical protein
MFCVIRGGAVWNPLFLMKEGILFISPLIIPYIIQQEILFILTEPASKFKRLLNMYVFLQFRRERMEEADGHN